MPGMITKSRLNLFVWLQKSWGSSQWGSCPGCLASKRCKTSGRNRGSFSFYVRGNWWSSEPDGKSAMLIAISRMDPVCLSWGQVWCCLFWCQALRGELLAGGVGVWNKEERRVAVWGCLLLNVLWEPACEHFMNYAEVRGLQIRAAVMEWTCGHVKLQC